MSDRMFIGLVTLGVVSFLLALTGLGTLAALRPVVFRWWW